MEFEEYKGVLTADSTQYLIGFADQEEPETAFFGCHTQGWVEVQGLQNGSPLEVAIIQMPMNFVGILIRIYDKMKYVMLTWYRVNKWVVFILNTLEGIKWMLTLMLDKD